MLSKKEHLFKKHLSKHSIETYKKLCREVDILFETILALKLSNAAKSKVLEKRQKTLNKILENRLACDAFVSYVIGRILRKSYNTELSQRICRLVLTSRIETRML